MRLVAALVLVLVPAQEAVDPGELLRRLDDDRLEVREAAEEALGTSDLGILPRLRQALPGLKGESRERLASTIRRLEHRARLAQILPRPSTPLLPETAAPFRAAFEALRKQIRIPVVLGADLEGLDRRVNPAAGRVSSWEALDRLLAAHGAASLEIENDELRVVRGARRLGVHRGAQAVWIQGLTTEESRSYSEPASNTSSSIALAAAWEPGGAAPIRFRAQVIEAVDSKGTSLLDPDGDDPVGTWFTAGYKLPLQVLNLQLATAPSPEALSISRLRVRAEFHYPLERADFRIDASSSGRRQANSGGLTLVLVQLRGDEGPMSAHLRLGSAPEEGQEILVESAKLTDKDGHVHDGIFPTEAAVDDEGIPQVNVSFPGMPQKAEPRRIDVRLVTKIHVEALDLDLSDVPLAGP